MKQRQLVWRTVAAKTCFVVSLNLAGCGSWGCRSSNCFPCTCQQAWLCAQSHAGRRKLADFFVENNPAQTVCEPCTALWLHTSLRDSFCLYVKLHVKQKSFVNEGCALFNNCHKRFTPLSGQACTSMCFVVVLNVLVITRVYAVTRWAPPAV